MSHRLLLKTAALAMATLVAAGAATAGEKSPMPDRIAAFTAAGPQDARLPLADVTDFEWDTVYAFLAVDPIEMHRARLGADYVVPDEVAKQMTDDSRLLVFVKDGKVVHLLVLSPPVWLTNADARPLGRGAVLTVVTRDPGPYHDLALTE